MILVDSSVIIDFLKGTENIKTALFDKIIKQNLPYGIASYTYQEVLQGARNEQEYDVLKDYLSTQKIYFLPEITETYEKAARLFYNVRRQGVTPRSVVDILIALTAIEHNLLLLHNDRNFDTMAFKVSSLKVLETVDLSFTESNMSALRVSIRQNENGQVFIKTMEEIRTMEDE